ncbi:trans-1,2-dihydrobenzene-1,2-diol dehydrogenase [Companilactobacillus paralimentarius DSM 13238 = JCM 10415]|jgi:Predicted dehydrogenases and related proteins|uniref:Trans-1,2-dihydrobenzene-1,2-diol dehydrogenase n=1 Tax=Companilactobacillus paralimentarius DSM 13238 = JCM 10415 TaxID=1122151 RepID=A0A0R1PQ36_9LACO|nr:Gfo/Idh/MocA family oxidoreductase [Companilactobacillus paralimentarius]KAE9564493.1 oxidoreductase [Companilactobacillus paralimentarius]KRL32002.1 trans-1,2-dihydrobenzene-1,2-diol dehydrogenase [Companilactobacillus paralimentarius DSM 13238 = JCM 10415]MDR4932731.1 Gfo/Idh/MocA family oxidoreductase [Companilactobacillus paralimentarius]QFR69290.1 gfo/Idh/MocA family oxidoreductase [Companilactobacillus paralimentarius]
MKKYNWGMIGTGWIAHEMADALKAVNGEIYGVSNMNVEKMAKFAQEKGIQHQYSNPTDMINDPNVDVIYIATPHTFHYQYIKEALNAGKHVFCEKAITVNAEQFDEVQNLAKKKNLILTEGFTLLHMPLYQQVKQLISDGKIGQVKLVQVNFGSLKDYDPKNRFFNKELAGGALLDIGGYATAFARSFLSKQPTNILTTVKYFETGVDEQSGIILKNDDEQMAVMALSMRAKQPKRGVISGTKGYIEISNYPRATEADITYTADAHTQTTDKIVVGSDDKALQYEVTDMQKYIDNGHDDGQLALSHDVAHILNDVRNDWGMKYPFE